MKCLQLLRKRVELRGQHREVTVISPSFRIPTLSSCPSSNTLLNPPPRLPRLQSGTSPTAAMKRATTRTRQLVAVISATSARKSTLSSQSSSLPSPFSFPRPSLPSRSYEAVAIPIPIPAGPVPAPEADQRADPHRPPSMRGAAPPPRHAKQEAPRKVMVLVCNGQWKVRCVVGGGGGGGGGEAEEEGGAGRSVSGASGMAWDGYRYE
ncbi:hypothetical protein DFH06DRAFT_1349448 [Mycena polygramma]|nr:hypothetical protein DFH06DRAFT_1349448 [Mycena polygramma]